MKNGTSNTKKNQTCFYYVERAKAALAPHLSSFNSSFEMDFLKAIDCMVLSGSITSMSDPALIPIIEIAARGTGIPKEAVTAYVEMVVAMAQPVRIDGSNK